MSLLKYRRLIKDLKKTPGEKSDGVIREYIEKFIFMVNDLSPHHNMDGFLRDIESCDKNGFLSRVCEFGIAYHFYSKFPEGFKYQVDSNVARTGNSKDKKKNFDFSFTGIDFKFNVEVKTIAPREKGGWIKSFLPKKETHLLWKKNIKFSSNNMLKLGRFLVDANSQLVREENALNFLIVCCCDLDELSDSLNCFVAPYNGILMGNASNKIVPCVKDLKNIDAVVLCNYGFLHNSIFDLNLILKSRIPVKVDNSVGSAAWSYRQNIPNFPLFIPLSDFKVTNGCFNIFLDVFFCQNYFLEEQKKNIDDWQDALFAAFNYVCYLRD